MEFLPLNGIIILQNMLSKKVISKKIYIFASNTKSGEWNSFHKIFCCCCCFCCFPYFFRADQLIQFALSNDILSLKNIYFLEHVRLKIYLVKL